MDLQLETERGRADQQKQSPEKKARTGPVAHLCQLDGTQAHCRQQTRSPAEAALLEHCSH
jgi:hypothetical protein